MPLFHSWFTYARKYLYFGIGSILSFDTMKPKYFKLRLLHIHIEAIPFTFLTCCTHLLLLNCEYRKEEGVLVEVFPRMVWKKPMSNRTSNSRKRSRKKKIRVKLMQAINRFFFKTRNCWRTTIRLIKTFKKSVYILSPKTHMDWIGRGFN